MVTCNGHGNQEESFGNQMEFWNLERGYVGNQKEDTLGTLEKVLGTRGWNLLQESGTQEHGIDNYRSKCTV